jgi:hypothetical protein
MGSDDIALIPPCPEVIMDSVLQPIVDVRPADPDVDLTAPPTAWCPGTARVRVVPWLDPVVDRRGHDPRSTYVERFWLGTLGPTATWLLRRLAAGFDDYPGGYDLDLHATAQSIGLSLTRGPSSPFAKAFARCVMFGLAHVRPDGYAVRRRLPEIARRHLIRMPDEIQVEHQRWVGAAVRLDSLQRGRALATAMLQSGDDTELIEPQLVALGLSAPTAAQVSEILRAEQQAVAG